MGARELKNNIIIRFLLERSLISEGQFEIIYKRRVAKEGYDASIKRGAYYRLLGQTRSKVESIVCSMILLSVLNLLDDSKMDVMQRLVEQIKALISRDISEDDAQVAINAIQAVLKQMSREIVA